MSKEKRNWWWRFVGWIPEKDSERESVWSVSKRRRGIFTVTVVFVLGYLILWSPGISLEDNGLLNNKTIEQFIQFGVFSVVLTFFVFEGVDIMGALSTWVATWALARKDALEKAEREAEKERTHRERVERELELLKAELDGLRMQYEIDRDSRK